MPTNKPNLPSFEAPAALIGTAADAGDGSNAADDGDQTGAPAAKQKSKRKHRKKKPPVVEQAKKAETAELIIEMTARDTPTKLDLKVRGYDVKPLTRKQSSGAAVLTAGMIDKGLTLENGTEVTRTSHVVKWIFEQAFEQFEARPPGGSEK